jgi:glycosyltransferase involved in cell wall biosynthesis
MKVLFILYHFPPQGGPAVQRNVKFIKYLCSLGIRPAVLTSKHPVKSRDNSLANDIPESVRIYYSIDWFAWLPGEIKKLFKKKFVPDRQIFWSRSTILKAAKIIKSEDIKIVYTSSPPHSVHLIGLFLKKTFKIKWVTDFRDEWTKNPLFNKSINKKLQKRMEAEVMSLSDTNIAVTKKGYNNFLHNYSKTNHSLIYNGFDSDDFKGIETTSVNNKKLTIAYSGRLNKLHSPQLLFNILSDLKNRKLITAENIKIQIIGNINNRSWIKKYPNIAEIVHFIDYKPHKECLAILSKADVLLLLATEMQKTEFIPAKLYEYLNLRKKILAVLSFKGEISSILDNYGNSIIVEEHDKVALEKAIFNLLSNTDNNLKPNENLINQFSRQKQAVELKNIFQRIYE